MDKQLQDQAAGTPQSLEEVARGRVCPCLPLEGLRSEGLLLEGPPSEGPTLTTFADLPLTWLPMATVEEACEETAGLEASVAEPSLEEGTSGKAAGLHLEEEWRAQDHELWNQEIQSSECVITLILLKLESRVKTYYSCPCSWHSSG